MQLLGLSALLLVSVQATAAKRPSAPLDSAAANAQYHVVAGEMAASREQPGVAAREFLKAVAIAPDVELAERATQMAIAARDAALAEQAARVWLKLEPNALEPREVLLRTALESGNQAELLSQGQAIIEGHAGGPDDGYHHVLLLLIQVSKEKGAAAVEAMRQLVERDPGRAAAQESLAVTALRFDNLPLAETAARKAVELSKGGENPNMVLANVLVRTGKQAEADAVVEKLAAGPKGAAARYAYARVLLEAGKVEPARTQLQRALAADPKLDEARFALGRLAIHDKQYAEAEKPLQPLLNGPNAAEVALQLGLMEETRRNWNQALVYYGKVNQGMAQIDARTRRAAVLAKSGQVSAAQALFAASREQWPPLASRLYRSEAEVLLDAGADEAALKLLDEALEEFADDGDLIYSRSLAYQRLGKLPLAEKDLRSLLAENADDARALNGLGYMLLTETSRTEEAAKMIRRAHELEPEDAAIIDSLGWAEFKNGRTQEALTWLQQAYDKFPDPEVAAHLGEVMWALGNKDGARSIWKKALADDPEHRVLKETVQRLDR